MPGLMSLPLINAYNPDCLGSQLGTGNPAGVAWPAANQAIYIPFVIYEPTVIKTLYTYNGGAVSGNADVGIYSEDGTRLTSTGSTALSGANTQQVYNIDDITLGPGRYYIALALNGTSSSIYFTTGLPRQHQMKMAGVKTETSAFPLPATATFSVYSSTLTLPLFGAATRTVV